MPQVEKEQFHNQSGGYVGVVTLTSRGDEKGMPVAPDETVWLSEPEQQLTANAPRKADDNPFIPQKVIQRNPETDAEEEVWVTPLVKINEARYVPAEARPLAPPVEAQAAPAPPATPPAAEEPAPAPTAPPVPPRAAAAAEAVSEPLPPAPVPGPSTPTPPAADPARVAPDDEGRVAEETAAASPGPAAEETGAALPPASTAPVGEYQAGEEVGTPAAPSGTAASDSSPPPAWTPETEG